MASLGAYVTGGGFPVAGQSIQLPPGHTYIYDYVTTVRFNEPDATSGSQARRDVGFTLTCKVALVPMFTRGQQTLVKLTVSSHPPDSHCQLSLNRTAAVNCH